MDYKNLIHKSYESCVASIDVEHDLKIALKTHERMPKFLANLERELIAVQAAKLKKDGYIYPDKYIVDMVNELTKLFVFSIQEEARLKRNGN